MCFSGVLQRAVRTAAVLSVLWASLLSAGEVLREDIDGDGRVDIRDAVALLRLGAASPGDPWVDLDRDGRFTSRDVLTLLLRIRSGTFTPLTGVLPDLGRAELYPTWNAVGVELPYSGEFGDSAVVRLLWREQGASVWKNGPDFSVDPRLNILNSSIFPLEPDTPVEVRIVASAPDAPPGAPLDGSTRTRVVRLETSGGTFYHVSPSGDDANTGTQERPFRTLGRAAREVKPGDMVYAGDGIYAEGSLFQRLVGTVDAPIVFAAAPGAHPVLDSSLEIAFDSTAWALHSGQVWRMDLPASFSLEALADLGYLAQDGERMFPYASLNDLVNDIHNTPRAWFLDRAARRIYARTGLDDSPAAHLYNLARHDWAILLSSSEHVVVRGFEIRFCGQAGIRISEGARHNVIFGNTIRNCPNGVYLKHEHTSDNLVLENEIREHGLLEIPWNSIKAGGYPRQGIMSWIAGCGNSFVGNRIHGWFDGIAVLGGETLGSRMSHRDTDIMFNRIWNISDDALEPDGGGVNLRMHGNLIGNAMVAISLAPVEYGPVYVTRNEATFWNLFFKLNVGGQWTTAHGWTYVCHNSGYGLNSANGMGLIGLTGVAAEGADTRNKVFLNNAMIGADRAVRAGYDGNNRLDHNCYWHVPGMEPRRFEWNGVTYSSIETFRAGSGQEPNGLYADPRFADTPHIGEYPWRGFWEDQISNYPLVEGVEHADFTLLPGSPLIDRGARIRGINDDYRGRGPDIGSRETPQ